MMLTTFSGGIIKVGPFSVDQEYASRSCCNLRNAKHVLLSAIVVVSLVYMTTSGRVLTHGLER